LACHSVLDLLMLLALAEPSEEAKLTLMALSSVSCWPELMLSSWVWPAVTAVLVSSVPSTDTVTASGLGSITTWMVAIRLLSALDLTTRVASVELALARLADQSVAVLV
jgi:hypothetical protein